MIASRQPSAARAIPFRAWLGFAAGAALLLAAWMVPGHIRAVAPALLERAGAGTPTLAELGEARLELAQPGTAALLLAGARASEAPESESERLAASLAAFAQRERALMPWGGEDPFLLPLTQQPVARAAVEKGESTPVARFFVTAASRAALNGFLANSRSPAVRDTLALRELENTGRFVPVSRAGGQTFEAMVLLVALLHQGEHLTPTFARVWRDEARAAHASGELGAALEPMFIDLLALARRLDWRQLTAVAGAVDTRATWTELGALARAGDATFDLVLAAALTDGSAERVIKFRLEHPDDADADLRLALVEGQGATRLLLARGVPVNRQSAPAPGPFVGLALLHPGWALAR